ncbi:MAG: tetratricopeptide repeat protein [Phycisphaerales bacterium]|jgi:tetratricopeptide (TPR) repeat protein
MPAPATRELDSSLTAHQRELLLLTLLGLAVFIVTAIPFYPALTAGYCDFDDPGFLLLNPMWRGVNSENLTWMFTTTHLGHYQPLTFLSYAIEYTLFHTSDTPVRGVDVDLNPLVPHATNILLHALNAVLVFFLARQVLVLARGKSAGTGPHMWAILPALLASLLWGVHPLRVESVAWITERRDVLSSAFLLGATMAYLHAYAPATKPATSDRSWNLSVVLLFLSLLSKAWGITFFVTALLLDIYPLKRLPWQPWKWLAHRRVLLQKIPFAVLGVIFAATAAHAQKVASSGQTMKTLGEWGVAARLAQSVYGLWFYIWRSALPTKHALIYELPTTFIAGEARWWVAAVAVLLLGAAGVWAARRRFGLGVALVSYVVLVAPVLGLVQSGVQLVAERYSYLALIPLCIALGAGLVGWQPRPSGASRSPVGAALPARWFVLLSACVVLGVLSFLTWRQCYVWRDTRLLWEQSIASGANGPVVHNFLARAMEKTQEYDSSILEYQRSIDADSTFSDSYFGIGRIHYQFGRDAEAEKYLVLAEKYAPDPLAAQVQLGLVYRRNPATRSEAVDAFTRAVRTQEKSGRPTSTGVAYLNLGTMLAESADKAAAMELLQKAARCQDTREDAQALIHRLSGQ